MLKLITKFPISKPHWCLCNCL